MRLRAVSFTIVALPAVMGGAWALATAAVDYIERTTRAELGGALFDAGETWARVGVDGLTVVLAGTAPDETRRFRAIELARGTIDAGRLDDAIIVASAAPSAAPLFALELLRNDDAVSLIGLVPASGGRPAITTGLARAGLAGTVTDMLETADHPAPEGWNAALAFGLEVIAELPRAKVRVGPGAVTVSAVTESEPQRAALTRRLEAAAPPAVALSLELTAPRSVIAPFTFGFSRALDGTARLSSCSAETDSDATAILDAARAAGLAEDVGCKVGLGAPTTDWAGAVASGIAAVDEMGGGSFVLRNLEAVLTGPPDFDAARLAEIGAGLDAILPDVYALATRGASIVETPEGGAIVYAPEFRAVLLDDGSVRLAGPVADRTAQIAVIGFAEAVFGHDKVMNTTVLDPSLPEGWPARVLAGIEGLALLSEGMLKVTPEAVTITGRSIVEDAEAEIAAFFAAKGSAPPIIDVAFDPIALLRAAGPGLPTPLAEGDLPPEGEAVTAADPAVACRDAIAGILDTEAIRFESGSATIEEDSFAVVGAIAEVLRGCDGMRFEITGHTDASGSAAANQRLSEARAVAVLAALETEGGIESVALTAAGYGPDRPIADNGTPEGRARNRRIEFERLPAEPDETDGAAEAESVSGARDGAQ